MADKELKVHRRIICMIFPMIQRAKNDRSVRRALPVYDNEQIVYTYCTVLYCRDSAISGTPRFDPSLVFPPLSICVNILCF